VGDAVGLVLGDDVGDDVGLIVGVEVGLADGDVVVGESDGLRLPEENSALVHTYSVSRYVVKLTGFASVIPAATSTTRDG